MKQYTNSELPTAAQLEAELRRERDRRRSGGVLRSAVYTLVVVAAVSILVATLWLPVLRICGGSMAPTLQNGEILLAVKNAELEPGDIAAFYYNNKILVKRVIGRPGDWINLDAAGNVWVNDALLEEPYLTEKALGDCNIDLPCQVPGSRLFVLGDCRSTSVDSRNTTVGCVAQEQILGRVVFRIWPLDRFGPVD